MPWPVNPDEDNHRLESRMRENRTYGSEGGEGFSPFRPLSISCVSARLSRYLSLADTIALVY